MASEIAAIQGSTTVVSAIKRASQSTGAGFDLLMKVAARESSLNPEAKAGTSSAAGLFQFIEQTWLSAVKKYGDQHGLESFAKDINRTASGKLEVADASRKDAILNLRFDPDVSASMAGELTKENAGYLSNKIGREASSTELYLAHFLGPAGAVKLLSAAANTKAADLLPAAARANTNVFYEDGRAKTVAEIIQSTAKSMGGVSPKDRAEEPPVAGVTPRNNTMAPASVIGAALADGGFALRPDMAAPTVDLKAVRSQSAETFVPLKTTDLADLPTRSRFAAMAYSVLQALDLTRLDSDRQNQASKER